MKLCPTCEVELSCCDFCQHYDFNGKDDVYTGDGFCILTGEKKDPGDFICDDFYCFLLEPK